MRWNLGALVVVAAVALGCAGGRAASAGAVRAAPHRYRVPAQVGQLVIDDAAFAELARAVKPDAAGTIAFDQLQTVVFQRYAVKPLVQVGHVIDEVLGAHGIALPTDDAARGQG